MAKEAKQMEAFLFYSTQKSEELFRINGLDYIETFMNCALGNNLKQAYEAFKENPQGIMTYYLHYGKEATNTFIEETEKQLGADQARQLRKGLDKCIAKRDESIKKLRAKIKASNEQTKRDQRISPDLWNRRLN